MNFRQIVASLFVPASLWAAAQAVDGASGVDSQVLSRSKHAWNGQPYTSYPPGQPELTVIRVIIPPHTTLPWHTHPMPNAAYVLSGHLTVEDRAGRRYVARAGDVINETVNLLHRGFTDDEACTLIVTYAGASRLPTSMPAPAG
jgi:quercetin dioxygenase-like cupin family protein